MVSPSAAALMAELIEVYGAELPSTLLTLRIVAFAAAAMQKTASKEIVFFILFVFLR